MATLRLMLSRFDDYPIHQMPVPVAQTGTADRNHYDRYFFNGYLPEGEVFFGGAMGLYPNRQVIDAAFSIVHDGRQKNLHVSGRAPVERAHTAVGPIRVEIVEPMKTIRMVVEGGEHGVEADVTFEARAVAIEEERQTRNDGNVQVMDVTRFTQSGTWSGWVAMDGTRIELDARVAWGTRDRSWGIRPVGEPAGGAPSTRVPQIFWLWAPLNFDDVCTYIALFDDAEGSRFYQHSLLAPVRRRDHHPFIDPGGVAELMRDTEFTIDWQPGTRRARAATMTLHPYHGEPHHITFDVLYTFQMCGISYSHPEWAHGVWKGELAVEADEWKLAEVDPMARHNLHIQNMCRVTLDGRPGWGILEQIAIGPHHPTGLTGVLDPYTS
jgi:hypothetical protein